MATTVGETALAGKIPGERIATEVVTSNSSTITTTETEVMSVTAAVVSGRTYRITVDAGIEFSVADDVFSLTIRQDSTSGQREQARKVSSSKTSGPITAHAEAEYTAGATEDKKFVATLDRESGSGNIILEAGGSFPSFMYVDYIRG